MSAIATAPDFYERFRTELGKAIVGQDEAIRLCAIALVAQGHVLLEGVPGTGKTLLAKTIARALAIDYARVQFTPDLLPADIVGTSVYDLVTRTFALRRGPIFTNILLADEINRAPAKVQSALLEAMEERGVTLEGQQLPLPAPFFVMATQNPVEYEGTYPLPEAQQDRFLFMARWRSSGAGSRASSCATRPRRASSRPSAPLTSRPAGSARGRSCSMRRSAATSSISRSRPATHRRSRSAPVRGPRCC